MELAFLDNMILASNELEYIIEEQKKLQEKVHQYEVIAQPSIHTINILYDEIICKNSPEEENNKWRLKNGVWILNNKFKTEITIEKNIEWYNDLLNMVGIKTEYEVYQDENGWIYTCNYELTMDEYYKIKKYFENKQIISDEMVIPSLIKKGFIKEIKDNNLYIDNNRTLQQADQHSVKYEDDDTLIDVLKRERENIQITMSKLAKGIGVSHTTISRIENGQISPTLETFVKYANYLGMKVKLVQKEKNEEQPKQLVKKPKKNNKSQ